MKHFNVLSLISFTALALVFSGCSSKKYFEPEQTFSASTAESSYGGNMVELSRDGGTLQTGQYVVFWTNCPIHRFPEISDHHPATKTPCGAERSPPSRFERR